MLSMFNGFAALVNIGLFGIETELGLVNAVGKSEIRIEGTFEHGHELTVHRS